jgi:hypothetical protein
MEEDILRTNLLSLAVAGLLMFVTGLVLYVFREQIGGNSRFVMTVPPIGVAAYVFVFNMYRHYGGNLPTYSWHTVREIVYSTAVAALIFGLFTTLLLIIVDAIKR